MLVAASQSRIKAVETLLKRGAKLNARALEHLIALHTAAQRGDTVTVELLVRYGAHLEARDTNFMTALHHACEHGHGPIVTYIIQKGASIDALGYDSKLLSYTVQSVGSIKSPSFFAEGIHIWQQVMRMGGMHFIGYRQMDIPKS